jgi:hypothetical protein
MNEWMRWVWVFELIIVVKIELCEWSEFVCDSVVILIWREREREKRTSEWFVRACLCVWVGLFVWVKISEWGECECVKELVWVFVCLFELLIVVNIELVNQWIKLQLCDWVWVKIIVCLLLRSDFFIFIFQKRL